MLVKQRPSAPWCVGSVFSPPQLLTSDLGPLSFNQVGKPKCLLSTGYLLNEFETAVSTSKQTENFYLGGSVPIIPRNLLQDHLQADAAFNEACITHCSGFASNRLQGLKCSDGSVLIFFPYGEGADHVASAIWYPGTGRTWSSVQTLEDASVPGQSQWSVSPSLKHSINQLSACVEHSSDNDGEGRVIIAARAIYHVFFCTASKGKGFMQYISTAVSKFEDPVAHVAWNPHVGGEAAVTLESGVVCLFDVPASPDGDPNRFIVLTAKLTIGSPRQRLEHLLQEVVDHDELSAKEAPQIKCDTAPNLEEYGKKWWRCEFGWLPQTLLVASSEEIFLVDLLEDKRRHDLRSGAPEKAGSCIRTFMGGVDVVASIGLPRLAQFCSFNSKKEHIMAFGRAEYGRMYEFAVATEQHLILFDIRQAETPILKWEHGMSEEPPGLLIMCPLSTMQSLVGEDKVTNITSGRIILAASFKSGDVRIFCYGSEVNVDPSTANSSKRQKVEVDEWDATNAWEIPSRLYAPEADVDDWRDVLNSSQGLYSLKNCGVFAKKCQGGCQNIAGIVLLPNTLVEPPFSGSRKSFTILQLTGLGEVLAQTYEASYKLRCLYKPAISTAGGQLVDLQGPKHEEPKYEAVPAFLKYIRVGSILSPYSKNLSNGTDSLTADYARGVLGKRPAQGSRVIGPKLYKRMGTTELKTLLESFLRDLNVPLTVYEVARKVLSMGLSKSFAPLAAGMPSHLGAPRHRGYKFPLVSCLLQSEALSPGTADCRPEDKYVQSASSDLAMSTRLQGKVPLVVLLETDNIVKSDGDPSSSEIWEDQVEEGAEFEDGYKLLQDGCEYLQGLINELVSKRQPPVISLSQSKQDCPVNFNDEGESDSHILLYHMEWRGAVSSESDGVGMADLQTFTGTNGINDTTNRVESGHEVGVNNMRHSSNLDGIMNTTNAESAQEPILDNTKKGYGASCEDIYHRFIAGRFDSKCLEKHPIEGCFKINPSLCPIKLCFTAKGETLGEGELTALNKMQDNFLQWQQSFPPHRRDSY